MAANREPELQARPAGSRLGHVPALDGIRGLAIALVVGFHAGWIPGGFVGVDVFFVLSGFLITTLLLEEIRETGRIGLRLFYERRARRLLPGLCGFLLAVVVVSAASPGSLESAAAGVFYVSNIVRAVGDPSALSGAVGHLWSLAEEEQFYLLWPALLVLLAGRWPRRLALVLGTAWAAFALYRVGALAVGVSLHRVYFGPDTHADPIVAGCLLAVVRSRGRLPRVGAAALAGLAVLAVGGATLEIGRRGGLALESPVAVVAGALLVAAALEERNVVSRILRLGPLVWLGTISYSLYLWHPLVDVFAGNGIEAIAFAILAAWLSTRYLEQPFRRPRAGGRQRREPAARPIRQPA